jgi:hypothetical protein
MSRTPKWLLYLVLLLIVANLIGLLVGGAFIMLVINVILVGIAGLIFIFLAARASERARAKK